MLTRRSVRAARCVVRAAALRGDERGLTLIEMLLVLCIISILAGAAWPSYRAAVCTGRRSDALTALATVQSAQERYRGAHTRYGTAADIGVAATSAAGHYLLSLSASGAAGYVVLATATGGQRADTACRCLQLTVMGADVRFASGPDGGVTNGDDANRQCWRA